jgi:hypothetical protein
MTTETDTLDQLQSAYKISVDRWVAALREEEALASEDHAEAEIDTWEAAGLREEGARAAAKDAKKHYEAALRKELFNF